jgi:23S rRNA (pseudouridine1915-N3)-methyltransferase
MRLVLIAVGRMRSGPERELVTRYVDRARVAGRTVGLADVALREIEESAARRPQDRQAEEGRAILALLPAGATYIVLDEGGEPLTSRAFAGMLAARRDSGEGALAFVLGGPDGTTESFRARASLVISLGRLTYPHQIARILVAEQIYRAITILAGHPYHRD